MPINASESITIQLRCPRMPQESGTNHARIFDSGNSWAKFWTVQNFWAEFPIDLRIVRTHYGLCELVKIFTNWVRFSHESKYLSIRVNSWDSGPVWNRGIRGPPWRGHALTWQSHNQSISLRGPPDGRASSKLMYYPHISHARWNPSLHPMPRRVYSKPPNECEQLGLSRLMYTEKTQNGTSFLFVDGVIYNFGIYLKEKEDYIYTCKCTNQVCSPLYKSA